MEGRDVLRHLLGVENEAAALFGEAAGAADALAAQRERRSREAYSAAYDKRVRELEADFASSRERMEADYRRALAAYRADLDAKGVDGERFRALAEALFFGDR